jgi:hypothetical protein
LEVFAGLGNSEGRVFAMREETEASMRKPILVLAVFVAANASAMAQDAKQTSDYETKFATRMFAGPALSDKNYACFLRRYDSAHLARHPLQKVAAMRLLVTAEKGDDSDNYRLGYSFRIGVSFVKRPGNFDSSGSCGSPGIRDGDKKVVFDCGVDCDGGGISVELKDDDKAALVRLERIRIWQNNKPDEEGLDLSSGADDKIFRLDRVKIEMCKALITDRKELAAIRTLKK